MLFQYLTIALAGCIKLPFAVQDLTDSESCVDNQNGAGKGPRERLKTLDRGRSLPHVHQAFGAQIDCIRPPGTLRIRFEKPRELVMRQLILPVSKQPVGNLIIPRLRTADLILPE